MIDPQVRRFDHTTFAVCETNPSSDSALTLRLAHMDKRGPAVVEIPPLSHQVLAEMVCTTRLRINVFMNRFWNQRFISYDGGLEVHQSLRSALRKRRALPKSL